MSHRKKSYQHFVDSELFQPNSMAYLENLFEAYIDGEENIGLSAELNQYVSIATQHRKICNILRTQSSVVSASSQTETMLCDYFRRYGHFSVDLGLFEDQRPSMTPPVLQGSVTANIAGKQQTLDATQWVAKLSNIYANDIGFEYMYAGKEIQQWFQKILEEDTFEISNEDLVKAYGDIARAEALERHLGIQFVGQKRFSLEGCEALIPCIESIITTQVELGYDDFVIGMAHRGRLNTLVNVLGVSVETLMAEFEGLNHFENTSGDVKYHLGHSIDRQHKNKGYHVALAYNPSHLEAINAVVMGNIRARIDRGETKPTGILIHGDASIAGQGVVMENLTMSQVDAYNIGGIVHIVANNQIGFTTLPIDGRSTPYCTDIAKMIGAPVMHVRADNLVAVVKCAKIAAMYRDKFKKDIFIDLIGYRKYGHNEADEPRATQPLMYDAISKKNSISQQCQEALVKQGIDQVLLNAVSNDIKKRIEEKSALIDCQKTTNSSRHKDWVKLSQDSWDSGYKLGITPDMLSLYAEKLLALPSDANIQRQVQNLMKQRLEMAQGQLALNWGMAELLAYQSLMELGFSVRLVGQDAIRGTFSHRQASLYDQLTGARYVLPKATGQTFFENYNSILSEYAALGFEYGYAETSPNTLVIFEAQFGDFINGAQIIIDQFISSGYQKWQRYCGLVMLLPHGYEGQGPEHSSARLERFLQLCAQDNMQVCVPSTPKQIYHLMMRQILRKHRCPLIIFSPKSLLRHPKAVSTLTSLSDDIYAYVIDDQSEFECSEKVVLCSGKVFYDLIQYREQQEIKHVAIIRVEQLHPFPEKVLKAIVKRYRMSKSFVWCQEEPENQGAWEYIRTRIHSVLPKGFELAVVARKPSAVSAVGYMSKHREQQAALMKQIFKGE